MAIASAPLLLGLALGATYYVDYGAANDSGAGTLASPWKYCPGDSRSSRSLSAGDVVVFKGGVTYAGNIELAFDGSAGAGAITYRGNTEAGDFGTGRAVISGNSGTTFRTHGTGDTLYVTLDNLEITSSAASGAGGISDDGSTTYLTDHLTVQNCYIHDLRDYTDAGCNVDGKGIMLERASNVAILDNRFERTGYYGIYFRGGDDGILVRGNTMTDQILWGISFIQTNGDVRNVELSGNTLYDLNYVYDNGYSACAGQYHSDWLYFLQVGQPHDFYDITIAGNVLYNTMQFGEYGGTAMLFMAHAPGTTSVVYSNVRIYNNVFYNPHAQAMQPVGQGDFHIFNNTCVSDAGLRCLFSYARTNGAPPVIELKNNLFVKRDTQWLMELGRPAQSNDPPVLTAENNLYWSPDAAPFFYNGASHSFASWQALGFDTAGSIGSAVDPGFAAYGSFPAFLSEDLGLGAGSPAVDAGADLSSWFDVDVAGNTRPQGAAWDIGAYERTGPSVACSAQGGVCCGAGELCQGGSFAASSDCGTLCCRGGGSCQAPPASCVNEGLSCCTACQSGPEPLYDASCGGGVCCDACAAATWAPEQCAEAELAELTAPMQASADAAASGGSYIETTTAEAGAVTFRFELPRAGRFVLQARVMTPAPALSHDSFYVGLDGEAAAGVADQAYDTLQTDLYAWDDVRLRGAGGSSTASLYDPMIWELAAGAHSLTFYGRELSTRIDRVALRECPAGDCTGLGEPACGCAEGTTQPCYSGPAGTAGVGACQRGLQSCVSGAFGACSDETLPAAEACGDGIDNDCDGATDAADPECGAADGVTVIDGGCPCTAAPGAAGWVLVLALSALRRRQRRGVPSPRPRV